MPRVTVVGTGFFGATVARKLAEAGMKVTAQDRRNHIGGNCFDYLDPETGILVQKYGTHIFHTNNESIWNFVNQFSAFIPYVHRVKAKVGNDFYTLPINLETLKQIYRKEVLPGTAEDFLSKKTQKFDSPSNIQEYCLSRFGAEVYELLIKGYTSKQWGAEPSQLPREIIQRIPLRLDFDDRYFSDTYQGLPTNGYTPLFESMLNHKNIEVCLNTNYVLSQDAPNNKHLTVYSGPLDELFQYQYGDLDWRNVRLEFETIECQDFQGQPVVNYPEMDVPFTRIHEFKHLYSTNTSKSVKTIIAREFPLGHSRSQTPSYPVRTLRNLDLASKYEALLDELPNFWAGGRLGSFMYLDMHMAIGQALKLASEILEEIGVGSPNNNT